MTNALKEYEIARQEHIEAVRAEVWSKDRVRKTHFRFLKAKEELRAEERELVNETELLPV